MSSETADSTAGDSTASSPAADVSRMEGAPRPRDARRSSGVLLPVSALPGSGPIGDFGRGSRRWLQWLVDAKQTLWQVLPFGPTTGFSGNSPYSALSAFAIDPIYIDLEALADAGWIDSAPNSVSGEAEASDPADSAVVDFEAAREKRDVLRRAHERWARDGGSSSPEYEAFVQSSATWLPDYALFMALRAETGTAWFEWPEPIRTRALDALARARDDHAATISFEQFCQFIADRQWRGVRQRAHELGLEIFGDLPIYVSLDSADVWVEQRQFQLDAAGRPGAVSGVPPDYYSELGQRWGNPLYRWSAMADDGYRWWIARLRRNARLFDVLRLDHFRGFASYWEIDAAAPDAVGGRWVVGPGASFFESVRESLPDLPLVAEDLGVITEEVHALRKETGLPGMRVLQFAFGEGFPRSEHAPHELERNTVLYTGTHDNNTLRGWWEDELSDEERDRVSQYLGQSVSTESVADDLCRVALSSVADRVVIPLQDVLGLGSNARLNTPGTATGNWSWRASSDAFSSAAANKLRDWTEVYARASDLEHDEEPLASEGGRGEDEEE